MAEITTPAGNSSKKRGGRAEMMLLIRSAPEATYGNIISLLDETQINDIKRYAIVDLDKADFALFSSKI